MGILDDPIYEVIRKVNPHISYCTYAKISFILLTRVNIKLIYCLSECTKMSFFDRLTYGFIDRKVSA